MAQGTEELDVQKQARVRADGGQEPMRLAPPSGTAEQFTPKLRLIKEAARRFADECLRPLTQHQPLNAPVPKRVTQIFAELGLGLAQLPRFIGGGGLPPLATALVDESLAFGDVNAAFALPQPGAFFEALMQLAKPSEQMRWLEDFIVLPETTRGAVAVSRDVFGSTLSAQQTADGYVLRGKIGHIWHAKDACRLLLVAPIVHPKSSDPVSCRPPTEVALVLRLPNPGIAIEADSPNRGLSRARRACVSFDDVLVPAHEVLAAGDLTAPLTRYFAMQQLRMASYALGTARAACAYVLSFAEEARHRGRAVPHFQSMGFLLVDMHLACETALAKVRKAAQAANAASAETHAAMAQVRTEADETAFFVTDSALQILDDGAPHPEVHPIIAWHKDVAQLAQSFSVPPSLT